MSTLSHLSGACDCGRYSHIIALPENEEQRQSEAQVHFGNDLRDRRSQATLLSAWLRVPLAWYRSSTTAFFPDEHQHTIQRLFVPHQDQGVQRKFCGYCGTQMTYWSEKPESEQDFIHITVGSLRTRHIAALEDMDLLPVELGSSHGRDGDEDTKDVSGNRSIGEGKISPENVEAATAESDLKGEVLRTSKRARMGSTTWFEEMLEGSRLGAHRKQRTGSGQSEDGRTTIEWEIAEFSEGNNGVNEALERDRTDAGVPSSTGSKRKAVDAADDDAPTKT